MEGEKQRTPNQSREDDKMKLTYIQKKEYTQNEQRMINLCKELDEAYEI